jgi:DNA-binding response OmpR family regulator
MRTLCAPMAWDRDESTHEQALDGGAQEYIMKPFDSEILRQLAGGLFDRGAAPGRGPEAPASSPSAS